MSWDSCGMRKLTYETGVPFLHHLSVWAVVHSVVDIVYRENSFGVCIPVRVSISNACSLLGLMNLLPVCGVRPVESPEVAGNGKWAVDFGIFRIELGLVKVVAVSHVVAVNGYNNTEDASETGKNMKGTRRYAWIGILTFKN